MDVWSFFTRAAKDRGRQELERTQDVKKAEVAAAWSNYLRIQAEADALFEAQKAALARWRALQQELHQAELAVLAGPPDPEKH